MAGNGVSFSTNTAEALFRLRNETFLYQNGAREFIPNVVLVITDGRSNVNQASTIPNAMSLRSTGATVFAVGVGARIDSNELLAIASSPNNMRLLNGFNLTEFDRLRRLFTAEACTGITDFEAQHDKSRNNIA